MAGDVVLYDSTERIATITINRPERRNTLNGAVVEGLAAAWRRFAASDDLVAIITATGNDAFSNGADLNDLPPDLSRGIQGVGVPLDKPVIAAVAGWCIGGAFILVQMADLCIAAENTRFLYPEAKVGYSGGLIASVTPRLPHKIAMEFMLVGDELPVQRAYDVGFVNRIVPVGEQVPVARTYAHKLAANAPIVMNMLKNFVGQTLPKSPSEVAAATRHSLERVTGSADFHEGIGSFKEKRKPKFTGS